LAGVLLVVVSAGAYGTVPIFAKIVFREGVSLPELLSWRFVLAAALLWTVSLLSRGAVPSKGAVARLVLMGAVGYAGQAAAFFFALARLPAATTALLLYTYPAMVTLGSAVFLGERLGLRKVVAVLVAFGGTTLVLQGQAGTLNPLGIAFALLSAAMYSAYVLFGSRFFADVPPIAAAATVMSATAVSFVTYAAIAGQIIVPTHPAQIGWIATIAVVGTALPVLAFVAGMPRIGPSRASILSTFEPVVTVALAAAVLREALHPLQIVGAACVVVSVAVLEAGGRAEPAAM
jgi:drug/metabolite transporter (DMT)-like permease